MNYHGQCCGPGPGAALHHQGCGSGSAFIFPPGYGSRRGKLEGKNIKTYKKIDGNCNFI